MPFELNDRPTPKKIHFIWVGGPIYSEYLKSIQRIAEIAKRDGYEINLWVDNEQNYHKTAHEDNVHIPNLKLRNIRDELFKKQQDDAFYAGEDPDFPLEANEHRARNFQSYVERELVGFKNYAAGADFIRLEILRQEGGWYFDTDTYFPEISPPLSPKLEEGNLIQYVCRYEYYLEKLLLFNQNHPFPIFPTYPSDIRDIDSKRYDQILAAFKQCCREIKENYKSNQVNQSQERSTADPVLTTSEENLPHLSSSILPLGLAVNGTTTRYQYQIDENYRVKNTSTQFDELNNDVMGSIPDSFLIKAMILYAMNEYKKLDSAPEKFKTGESNTSSSKRTMDAKRYPNSFSSNYRLFPRRYLTIQASGPGVAQSIICKYWPEALKQIKEQNATPEEKSERIKKALMSLLARRSGYGEGLAAGLKYAEVCDNTWLRSQILRSFDTDDIMHHRSIIEQYKSQIREQPEEDTSSESSHPKLGKT